MVASRLLAPIGVANSARRGRGRHQPRSGGPGRGGLLRLCAGLPKRGGGLENDLAVDAPHVLVTDVHGVLSAGHVVVLRHVFTPVAIGQRPGLAQTPILRAFQAQLNIDRVGAGKWKRRGPLASRRAACPGRQEKRRNTSRLQRAKDRRNQLLFTRDNARHLERPVVAARKGQPVEVMRVEAR